MPDISNARTGELLRALFGILQQNPEGLRARAALDQLRATVQPTAYELGSYSHGELRFDNIVRFATVDCAKAGWMVKDGGRWFVTDAGIAALTTFPNPADFYGEASRLYRSWKKAQPVSVPAPDQAGAVQGQPSSIAADPSTDASSPQAAAVTLEVAQEQAREQIAAYLHAMDPYEFQKLVGDLLSAMSYHVVWISPPGKDDGIDLLAYPDPLGTQSPRIKVQVKRYASSIPVGEINAFMGNLGSDEVGIFVATGGFTADAQRKARTDKQHRVTLVDLERLVGLWTEHYPRLDQAARRRLPLQPVYFLAPES